MPFTLSVSRIRFQSLIHARSPEDSDTEIHFASGSVCTVASLRVYLPYKDVVRD